MNLTQLRAGAKIKNRRERGGGGEKPLNSRDCALGNVDEAGTLFCSVPPSEPTSSTGDVWAICTQHARRATERELL